MSSESSIQGGQPWFAWLAASLSLGALIFGIAAYVDYNDAIEKVDAAQQQLDAVLDQ